MEHLTYILSKSPPPDNQYDCDNNSRLFLGMQFGAKSLPGIIMLFAGIFRLCSISHMAKASVQYSFLFKSKVLISGMMSFVCFLYMVVVFATPNDAKTFSGYINSCGKEAFSLLFLI